MHMTTEIKQLQDQLDPTTGAMAVTQFPVYIRSKIGFAKHMILSNYREVTICNFGSHTNVLGYDLLVEGSGEIIPLSEFIDEMQSILAELKEKMKDQVKNPFIPLF